MAIDWKSADSTHGLLVACIATNEKLDLKLAAQLLSLYRGEEVTYDAIQNRMRVVKREALQLKERFANGEVFEGVEKPKKAKGTKEAVLSGRVTKSGDAKGKKSAAKKVDKAKAGNETTNDGSIKVEHDAKGALVKQEADDSDDSGHYIF